MSAATRTAVATGTQEAGSKDPAPVFYVIVNSLFKRTHFIDERWNSKVKHDGNTFSNLYGGTPENECECPEHYGGIYQIA